MTSHSRLPVIARAGEEMGAYPLLVSLLDIGNGVFCAYAWNVGRAVEDEAFR